MLGRDGNVLTPLPGIDLLAHIVCDLHMERYSALPDKLLHPRETMIKA
jgi:hypothetical protein